MKDIYKYVIALGIGLLAMYFIMKQTVEYIEVPVEIEVPVPVIEKEFDTIYLPGEVIKEPGKTIVDSTYYDKYVKLKTLVEKDSAYKDAITIREYKPTVEDDTIKIEAYTKVRGTLLESQISYVTKPYSIKVDTTLKITAPKKSILLIGGNVVLPAESLVQDNPSIEAGLIFVNKKHTKAYNLTYDPVNKNINAGLYFKL